ncbi:hypothetical protein K1T71_014417 [Dendrolimus kikuchii]|uniref:Uncharacterized protein n=1 Tax=Dendrolimus kikuchii TaxID=765133 RepID=A0ACC1CE37_9NEOP|nr:hypothetical protein K1T71_014417 [Dendrolimus kikuchii]
MFDKFKLLNSQEYNEEINWSPSSSSDVENASNNAVQNRSLKTRSEKRKRKKTVSKSLSNLDIKVINSSPESRIMVDCEKSMEYRKIDTNIRTSPILQATNNKTVSTNEFNAYVNVINSKISPILPMKKHKSPILQKKSPSHKVRKQIFNTDCGLSNTGKEFTDSHIKQEFHSPTEEEREIIHTKIEKYDIENIDCDIESLSQCSKKIKLDDDIAFKSEDYLETIEEYNSSQDSKSKILANVKLYFDSYFSSGNTSLSISEDITPKNSSNSDDIQILTCKTQMATNSPKKESPICTITDRSESKKSRYKKDGLAYRLSNLLKKQNADVNLWRHEKFLAGNINFLIPKTSNLIFRIKSVEMKYGCHLLHAIDENDVNFFIIINNEYVIDNILCDSILKLYKPYTIRSINNVNLITNVCKFENHLMNLK